MKHTPYDADQRNGTHECDPKAIEHRLEVATDAMIDWSMRNSELRKQNREKNELIVQLREELAQADSARLYAQSEILCRDKQVEALRLINDETTEALRQFTLWAPRGWSLELDQALTLARHVELIRDHEVIASCPHRVKTNATDSRECDEFIDECGPLPICQLCGLAVGVCECPNWPKCWSANSQSPKR